MKRIPFYIALIAMGITQNVNAATAVAVSYGNKCATASPWECLDVATSQVKPDFQISSITYNGGSMLSISIKEGELKPHIGKMINGDIIDCGYTITLQDRLCTALGIKRGSVIPAGRYKCTKAKGSIIMEMAIKEQGVK